MFFLLYLIPCGPSPLEGIFWKFGLEGQKEDFYTLLRPKKESCAFSKKKKKKTKKKKTKEESCGLRKHVFPGAYMCPTCESKPRKALIPHFPYFTP